MQSGDWKNFVQATTENDFDTVAYYLRSGADPNYFHPEIMTSALIEAARHSTVRIVELLMRHGGNPSLKSQMGESAWAVAKVRQHQEILKALKK